MGWADVKKDMEEVSKEGQEKKQRKDEAKDIKEWLLDQSDQENKFVCMVLGKDGTGKSPLALSHLTDEDIKQGKRVLVIDLDGGNIPLVNTYHKERCEKLGRKVNDVFFIKNPLTEVLNDGEVEIDYKATFNKIKGTVNLLKDTKFREEMKFKYVVFDGLSTLLEFAENQMRVEKHLQVDGGVNMAFWKRRNKMFRDVLEMLKSLPISSFFIGHDDFIRDPNAENFSAVKKLSHSMMHQKIICEKLFLKDKTQFVATIAKSKYNVSKEGEKITFGEIILDGKQVTFEPQKVLEELQ